jgi:hypothetical protein
MIASSPHPLQFGSVGSDSGMEHLVEFETRSGTVDETAVDGRDWVSST